MIGDDTRQIEACIERCLPNAGEEPYYRRLVARSVIAALFELKDLKRAAGRQLSAAHGEHIVMMKELWPELYREVYREVVR